jgi:hypothetical protein
LADLADAITDELIAGFGSLPNTFVIGRGRRLHLSNSSNRFREWQCASPL